MKTISVDFDGTFTEIPILLSAFVSNSIAAGHQVITVTSRRNTLENRQEMEAAGVYWPIVFAYDAPKKLAAIEAGYAVDIWLDDNPHGIGDGTENVATQTVFEIELRHVLKTLNEETMMSNYGFVSALIRRLETVIGDSKSCHAERITAAEHGGT